MHSCVHKHRSLYVLNLENNLYRHKISNLIFCQVLHMHDRCALCKCTRVLCIPSTNPFYIAACEGVVLLI